MILIRLDFPKCDPCLFWVSICRRLQQNTRLMIILNICTICGQFMTSFPLRALWPFWVILKVILSNSLGNKSIKEPNQRGLKLFEFANHFNLCSVDLLETCQGPTESYVSHCGRFRSTIDYVCIPNCLINLIAQRHLNQTPIIYLTTCLSKWLSNTLIRATNRVLVLKNSPAGQNFIGLINYYCDEIYNKYVQPLFRDLKKVSDSSPLKADQITKLITSNSSQLLCPKKKKRGKSVFVRLPVGVKTVRSFSKATLSLGSKQLSY